jgi:hypothetical protein
VVLLSAAERGVAFTVAGRAGSTVQRTRGAGCDLVPEGAPVAGGLLDVDDAGNVYVLAAEAQSPGVLSTLPPGAFPADKAVKVSLSGEVSELISAPRGMWGFGVAPAGDALWVSACGPNGIFAVTADGVAEGMSPPQTLWEQRASALTDARTFWSVGPRTCGVTETVTPACGFALVRATPEGAEEVGTTLFDDGEGYMESALARCGGRVCGVLPQAVAVWDGEGELVRRLALADVGALPSERIVHVSGNRSGVYVLLRGERGELDTRVVFVPLPAE